ncbi:RNA polymerase III subunit Rpc25-domain-containing protein [Microdochium trichocladiopsis]|uniref:DNA-directed RNA polymerase subunit n=1 Tax=Microdochium trichocladiopsis TaxID=1682393 RepID=A0A9P8Y3H2_9PEZI|nr:RNA polymerase III subunit Rpc25-domain-containing protein [Microdochium trichocladiopsis]KAH7026483.1 RNA polymerase III subunit Rpc25-domain-containing protein [Microdochium trichocladiopsis]
MFILTKIADLVQIKPSEFSKASRVAIEDNINAKYANRVIQKIGLCICMYDLLWASEGLIGHGTGMVNVNVEFRLMVFRPFKGETLLGKISSATPEGIHVRTEFFEEIFVPYKELPENTEFDHNEQAWTWIVDEERMYYDKNEMVRLQVIDEAWNDQIPDSAEQEAVDKAKKVSPYSVTGSMLKEGLGVCLWWE